MLEELEDAPKTFDEQDRFENLLSELNNRELEYQNLIIQYHQACKINKTYLESEIVPADSLQSTILLKNKKKRASKERERIIKRF
jgi:hypothetical protein